MAAPKDYVTDLVLSVDGREVARQDVRVNDPLRYDGVMFHQAHFGIAAVMEIRTPPAGCSSMMGCR